MAETNLPVTPGSGALVGGTTDTAGNFVQSIGVEDVVSGAVQNVLPASSSTALSGAAALTAPTGYTTGTLTLNVGSPNTVWYDLLNYPWISVEILTNTTPATLTFQTSGDASQTNASNMILDVSNGPTGAAVPTTNGTTQTYYGPRAGRYFRVSSNVSGAATVTLAITFYTSVGASLTRINSITSTSATGSAVPAGAFYVAGLNGSGNLAGFGVVNPNGDGQTLGTSALETFGGVALYNGTSDDRMRNNTTGVVVAAGATTTQTAVALTTYNAKKLILAVNITAGAGSLVVTINGVTASSYTYTILTSSSLTGIADDILRVFPGATAGTNTVNDVVPRNVTITATVTGSITYGIDYILGV